MKVITNLCLLLAIAGCYSRAQEDSSPQVEILPGQSEGAVVVDTDETNSDKVKVYLNPLVMLLEGAEQQKGAPLTQEEVIQVRDNAGFVMMSPEQADKFYTSLDAQMPIHRIDPEQIWEEWQAIRDSRK